MRTKMNFVLFFRICLLFSLSLRSVCGTSYEITFDIGHIFENCQDNPNGLDSFIDMTNFTYMEAEDYSLYVKGDIKMIWDVEPTDRVAARMSAFRFERGAWQPTVYSGFEANLCERFYASDTLWYAYWTKYITNKADKYCFNNKGAIIRHDPYYVNMTLANVQSFTSAGRYKLVFTLTAYDKLNMPRKTQICIAVKSEVIKKT